MRVSRSLPLIVRLSFTFIALAITLSACAPPVGSQTSPTLASQPVRRANVIRVAWADVGVPTPFRVSTTGPGGAVLLTLLYDTLTWKDERGIVPWLATSWEISPDGLDYTFTLADNVTWHDGKPLDAGDVAFSFDYYARHPYRWMSTGIAQSAAVVYPNQVRIHLRQPYAPFLEDIAGTVPVIPKHVWSKVGDPATYDGSDATVGSGPFKLAEYRSAEGAYRLVANPSYFHGQVTIGEFQQLNVPVETQIQAAQQGQLDLVMSTDASVAEVLANDPRVKVFETPPLSVVRLAVNTRRAPLDRPEVRQAIMYALDRARIAATVTKALPIVGSAGVIPPETPWFNPAVRAYPFDLEQARALLAGQRHTFELLADPLNRDPELIQPMLQAAGITIVTKRVDAKTRTQLLREGSFQLALVGHIGVGGDPDFLRRWYAGEEPNDFAQGSIFHDAQYAQLGLEQAASVDSVSRKALVFRMEDILAEQLPTIVLYYRRFYWVYDSTKLTPMNTWGGLINGVPLVYNKLIFLR